jgi:2-isopropylmalate synthase
MASCRCFFQRSERGEAPRAKLVFPIVGTEFSCEGAGDRPVDATGSASASISTSSVSEKTFP